MHRCCGNDQCLKSKSNIVYIYKSVSCMSVGSGGGADLLAMPYVGTGKGALRFCRFYLTFMLQL